MVGSPCQSTSDLLWDLRLSRKYAGSQGLCWGQATLPRTERKAGRRSHYLTERPTWNSPGGKGIRMAGRGKHVFIYLSYKLLMHRIDVMLLMLHFVYIYI